MRDYVRSQSANLLRRLAFQVSRAAKSGDAEAIHDLRVSIRRFSRCLRIFAQFYPGNSWKKVRRQLDGLMDKAGSVRDLDIAMELLDDAGVGAGSPVVTRLREERRQAQRNLLREIRLWKNRGFSKQWRSRLDLTA
jgi:CHAD domain-containing protein